MWLSSNEMTKWWWLFLLHRLYILNKDIIQNSYNYTKVALNPITLILKLWLSSALFRRTGIMHMIIFESLRSSILCIKFKNMTRCSLKQHRSSNYMLGWDFTYIWKILTWPHIFIYFMSINLAYPCHLFIEVPVHT